MSGVRFPEEGNKDPNQGDGSPMSNPVIVETIRDGDSDKGRNLDTDSLLAAAEDLLESGQGPDRQQGSGEATRRRQGFRRGTEGYHRDNARGGREGEENENRDVDDVDLGIQSGRSRASSSGQGDPYAVGDKQDLTQYVDLTGDNLCRAIFSCTCH
ncbi:hypothetical protein ACA910_008806 [Epithemia clementina (nom. ined.)]